MRRSLLDILVDPVTKTSLRLEERKTDAEGNILEGVLLGPDERSYPITNGIPRFVLTEDSAQKQTQNSFGFKWRQRDTYDSPAMHAIVRQWLIQRYGFDTIDAMRAFFRGRRRILDAGSGSGFGASLWMNSSWGGSHWTGAEISPAVDVAQERLGSIVGTHFVQADILQLPFPETTSDTIVSDGVLHHTPSTELALKALVPLLEPGGEILFYVYRKKAPVREFTDDHIRGLLSCLSPEDAWDKLRPLTRLGQALAELHAEVEVQEDVPYLGLKAGRYDVQRLIYWHFAKLFWNEAISFEENNHVNFDWYHPCYSHRQTEDEVRRWCEEAGLSVFHFNVQESGMTVRGIKR